MLLATARRAFSILTLIVPAAVLIWGGWLLMHRLLSVRDTASASAVQPQLEAAKDPGSAASRAPSGDTTLIQPGDTLKIAIYERLVTEEEKWMARSYARRPPLSFQQRVELSGDYEVQENGRIIIPLLGAFSVGGKTLSQFEAETKQAFDALIGRFAFMSVTIERQPVYVVGPVKKPGAYKYFEGMTILHLIALSGGYDRAAMDLSQVFQAAQELETKAKANDTLKRSMARLAVLEAERSGEPAAPPEKLVNLVGAKAAKSLVEAELSVQSLAFKSEHAQQENFGMALKAAKDELNIKVERRQKIETAVKLRSDRVQSLKQIGEKVVSRAMTGQAEADLSDVKTRLDEASISIRETEARIEQLERDQAKAALDAKVQRERELLNLRSEISEADDRGTARAGALQVVHSLLSERKEGAISSRDFEVVRVKRGEPSLLEVDGTTVLMPGDLVRIKKVN